MKPPPSVCIIYSDWQWLSKVSGKGFSNHLLTHPFNRTEVWDLLHAKQMQYHWATVLPQHCQANFAGKLCTCHRQNLSEQIFKIKLLAKLVHGMTWKSGTENTTCLLLKWRLKHTNQSLTLCDVKVLWSPVNKNLVLGLICIEHNQVRSMLHLKFAFTLYVGDAAA